MKAKDLREIASEYRIIADRGLDDVEITKGLREAATNKGIDWSQLKALVLAQAKDARDDGDRVGKLIEKADFALSYAEMLKKRGEDERPARSIVHVPELASSSAVEPPAVNRVVAGSIPASSASGDAGPIPDILNRRLSAQA